MKMARVTSHHLKRMSASRSCNLRAVACLRQATRSETPSVPPPTITDQTKGYVPHWRRFAAHGYKFVWFGHQNGPVAPARFEYPPPAPANGWQRNGARYDR